MTDTTLSRAHSLALLQKLATDDAFRSRYEASPAAALVELGVPQSTIANLKAACLVPTTLATKAHFEAAHTELASAAADACVGMIIPDSRLDFGKKA